MGTFAETSGTYVNAEGRWQEFRGCAQPVGEARPGWKILRVLGNLLDLDGFDYESSTDSPGRSCGARSARSPMTAASTSRRADRRSAAGGTTSEVRSTSVDAIVRRAPPLQMTQAGRAAAAAG